jgi:DNA-binding CsgD family transcriptional regulator
MLSCAGIRHGIDPVKQTLETLHEHEEETPSSARFRFCGVEYWVVGRDLTPPENATQLTPAEARVLLLLRAGSTYEEIAAKRGCSRHTVAKHIASVLRKLNAASQRELELLR